MNYQIGITTRDGAQFGFTCRSGQSLLAAAEAAAITLPSQCKSGACGACAARVVTGNYELGEHNPAALPAHEPGAILMCCTVPRSDLHIAAPYDSAKVLRQSVPVRSAHIITLETIALNTVKLVLCLDADDTQGSAAMFEPGQFAELEVPASAHEAPAGGVRRPWSFANTGNWEGRLEFLIRLQPQGAFSGWLRDHARPGDALLVHGPQGGFGLLVQSLRPRWFVAGGTGLAPVLSMLRHMAEYQEPGEARLFFGVTHENELFMLDELERLQAALPQLQVTLCVWRPQGKDWAGFRGTPVEALGEALAQTGVKPDLYVCGPPALVNGARAAAVAAQVPAEQFVSERFAR